MCAHTAIVFLRYMFLAVGVRENNDLRSAGPLFCLVADELVDISFAQAFEKLQLFLQNLLDGFNVPVQMILAFVADFVASIPADLAQFLALSSNDESFQPKTGCEV